MSWPVRASRTECTPRRTLSTTYSKSWSIYLLFALGHQAEVRDRAGRATAARSPSPTRHTTRDLGPVPDDQYCRTIRRDERDVRQPFRHPATWSCRFPPAAVAFTYRCGRSIRPLQAIRATVCLPADLGPGSDSSTGGLRGATEQPRERRDRRLRGVGRSPSSNMPMRTRSSAAVTY
jgi:hypothetical protein